MGFAHAGILVTVAALVYSVVAAGSGFQPNLDGQLASDNSFQGEKAFHRQPVQLTLTLPTAVISLTNKDQLKVRISADTGSAVPDLKIKVVRILRYGLEFNSVIINQELVYESGSSLFALELPGDIDVGQYTFVFEIKLSDKELKKHYDVEKRHHQTMFITGNVDLGNAQISVIDSDLGTAEIQKIDFKSKMLLPLSANHLQKLQVSFQLSTKSAQDFVPHQAFIKLIHESKLEHLFLVPNSGKQFELILDFLSLLQKLFYLSGRYEIQLTVGDAVMENSFSKVIGRVDLSLPEQPENSPCPPPPRVDQLSRYGPQSEITHIFRAPEKRPPRELSVAFLVTTLLPFIGFLVGLQRVGVNFKNFPAARAPAAFGALFHACLLAVLLLYLLFWLKLNLFSTLKILGFLGVCLLFVGNRILSHLASASSKLKSA